MAALPCWRGPIALELLAGGLSNTSFRVDDGALERAFDAMKAASALREALWARVSAVYLDLPGADHRGHAERFLARTAVALAEYECRHGRLPRG